jgi:prepilin-type N-terminal cleavage/methylation domain-containing protein/prepilin-type processing-associated H-X9-DG protein
MNSRNRRAFTLIELLVVITIIALFLALSTAGMQAVRAAASRCQCANNLARLGMALNAYEAAHGVLPPGSTDAKGPIESVAQGNHISWLVHLLPHIDEGVSFQNIDLSKGAYDRANAPVRRMRISLLVCPSDAACLSQDVGVSSYAACHHDVESLIDVDNHGVMFLNSHVAFKDITDGLTHTIFVGEKLAGDGDLGWMSGTRATLRNTGTPINAVLVQRSPVLPPSDPEEAGPGVPDGPGAPPGQDSPSPPPKTGADPPPVPAVGGFASHHGNGANFLFGDGAVRLINDDIKPSVYQQLGHRADGKLLTEGPTRGD